MDIRYWWWVLASTAFLLFWPAFTLLEPFNAVEFRGSEHLAAHLAVVGGHLLAGLALKWLWSRRERLTLESVLLTAIACQGMSLLFVLFTRSNYSRIILLGSVAMSIAITVALYVALGQRNSRIEWIGAALLSVVAIATAAIAFSQFSLQSLAAAPEESGQESRIVNSAYYPLEFVEHFGQIEPPAFRGGALTHFGDDLLLVTGDGIFYRISLPDDDADIQVDELSLRAPMNRAEFLEDLPEGLSPEDFRTADVLARHEDGSDRLYVSHLYWKRDQQCYVVRLSETTLDGEDDSADASQPWTTLFESEPCISYEEIPIFRGYEMGGRIVDVSDEELLMTVGDFGFGYTTGYAQNPEASYGKILRIRMDDGSSSPFSIGHRNPQGLLITAEGDVWSTEHGPRGGDELNLLEEGKNYGWPYVTYGTAYDRHDWPVRSDGLSEDAYTEPVYAWVPSIGVSNLIESRSPLFPMWNGDFLVASMRERTLFRVHLASGRAVVTEPIPTGGRIRDLIQDSRGRIVLWMDSGSLIVIQPVQGAGDSAAAFLTQCGGCHEVDDDGTHGIGPDLGGVFGRPIASADGYEYSQALSQVSGDWTEDALRRYLADPQEFAPGTKMTFVGLMNDDEMDKIIDYLTSLSEDVVTAAVP